MEKIKKKKTGAGYINSYGFTERTRKFVSWTVLGRGSLPRISAGSDITRGAMHQARGWLAFQKEALTGKIIKEPILDKTSLIKESRVEPNRDDKLCLAGAQGGRRGGENVTKD